MTKKESERKNTRHIDRKKKRVYYVLIKTSSVIGICLNVSIKVKGITDNAKKNTFLICEYFFRSI